MTERLLAGGNSVAMTYDANGNITSITPPGKPTHTFGYNIFENLESYLPPNLAATLSGAVMYSYNLDQQLTDINRPDGKQIQLNYDSTSGLLNQVRTPSGNYQFSYTPNSNLISSVTSPDGLVLNYQYAGHLPTAVRWSAPISSLLGYSYNSDGSLKSLSVTDKTGQINSVSLSYDKDGLMSGIGSIRYSLNNYGAMSKSLHGIIQESVQYNKFGEKISDIFSIGKGKDEIVKFSYERDKLGRIVATNEGRGRDYKKSEYQYDLEGRLIKIVRQDGHAKRFYKYDTNGNRVEAFAEHGYVKAEYDEQDRLISYGGNKYSYNAHGDLLT